VREGKEKREKMEREGDGKGGEEMEGR